MHGAELGQVDSNFGDGPVHAFLSLVLRERRHLMGQWKSDTGQFKQQGYPNKLDVLIYTEKVGVEAPIEIIRRSFDNCWRGDLGVSDYALGTALNCLLHFFQNKLHSVHAQDGTVQGALMLPSGDPLPAWRLRLRGNVMAFRSQRR